MMEKVKGMSLRLDSWEEAISNAKKEKWKKKRRLEQNREREDE